MKFLQKPQPSPKFRKGRFYRDNIQNIDMTKSETSRTIKMEVSSQFPQLNGGQIR